jgi:NADPH:quinone reductase-like Zn-dependent oxidoreductase
MRAWVTSPTGLAKIDAPEPQPGPGEIVIAVRAVSINPRDVNLRKAAFAGHAMAAADADAMAAALKSAGFANPQSTTPIYIPCSDAAGEVIAVGPGVTRFGIGDRVITTFYTGWITGRSPAGVNITSRGQAGYDGVLAERVVTGADWAVAIPDGFSYEEAATLPCAALTAWHAVVERAAVRPGETMLILGTGGVSLFAMQFAKAAGARVIITSSSDEKLQRAAALGADVGINYSRDPEWQHAVMAATDGKGVDHVIEVGGGQTVAKSVEVLAQNGHLILTGALSGFGGVPLLPLIGKAATVSGVIVGSRDMLERMISAMSVNGLRPIIDRTMRFEQADEALAQFEAGGHFGKVVLTM